MMQIKSIILYNDKGEIRQLDFALNKVNLITGEHNTGKSALIPIINYCLGCSEFEIPDGVIRNNVTWYAVLYQIGDIQVFIAKPKPRGDEGHEAFYRTGLTNIPKYTELVVNSTDDHVKKGIFSLLRRALNMPDFNYEQAEELKTTIEYTYFYLFQPIKVLVSNDELFYKQDKQGSSIKESLPYFIGTKTEKELSLQKDCENKKKELNAVKKDLGKSQINIKTYELEITRFFEHAQELELIEKNLITQSLNIPQMVEYLNSVIDDDASRKIQTFVELKDCEPVLRVELKKLKAQQDEINYRINAIKSYNQDIKSYEQEAGEHRMRLQSIGLFANQTSDLFSKCCPLCQSELKQTAPEVSAIRESLSQLDKNLKNSDRDDVYTQQLCRDLEKQKEDLAQKIKQNESELLKVVTEKRELADSLQKQNLQHRKVGELIGGVKHLFNTNKINMDTKSLSEKQKMLEQEVSTLEATLEQNKDTLRHKLNALSRLISEFAKRISLSHQGNYLFDEQHLRITVSNEDSPKSKPVSMKSMGGLNISSCHLITLLALHKCFIDEKSLVPNFLILDQPIQGCSSEDADKIKKIMQLMIQVCEESGLQIILTEYEKNLPMEEQLHRIKPHWTAENALIPKDWIN